MRTHRTNAMVALSLAALVAGCGGTTDNRFDSTPQNASMTNIGSDRGGMGSRARDEAQATLTNAPADWVVLVSKTGLYAVKPDGTMVPPLPSGEGYAAVTSLAKGKGFAFAYRVKADAQFGVYVNTTLTTEKADEWVAPAFASVESVQLMKDGKGMAILAAKKDEPLKLYRVAKAVRMPMAVSTAQSIALNPNDDTVAFIEKGRLMVSKLGSDQAAKPLVSDKGQDADPIWTPDGKRVVFASTRAGGVMSLFVVGRDGKNLAPFGPTVEAGASKPAISADGKRLVYTSPSTDGKTTVQYVVALDGKSKPVTVKPPAVKTEADTIAK